MREQTAADGQICRRGALAPARVPIDARAIIDIAKDERRRLVLRRLREDRDRQRRHTRRVQDDGHVIEVLEDADAKGVDEAVGDEHGGVDADGLGRGGDVVGALDEGGGGDEVGEAEGDARGHGDLAQQVEPARDPGRERRPARRRHERRPEVGAAARRDRRHDLAHGRRYREREEGHDDPADAHDCGGIQPG